MFHIGHLQLIKRLREMGDRLIIGVSTDDFNLQKGKKCIISYEQRAEILSNIVGVDLVIPETNWEQKEHDIKKYNVDVFAMGDDWLGKFDYLSPLCEVTYLPRTDGVSTTYLKSTLSALTPNVKRDIDKALELLDSIRNSFS